MLKGHQGQPQEKAQDLQRYWKEIPSAPRILQRSGVMPLEISPETGPQGVGHEWLDEYSYTSPLCARELFIISKVVRYLESDQGTKHLEVIPEEFY